MNTFRWGKLVIPVGLVLCSSKYQGERTLCSGSVDPFACEQKVCKSKAIMLQEAMRSSLSKQKLNESKVSSIPISLPSSCPVDREELGNHTWALLHTIGAYYPEEPSVEEQSYTTVMIIALAKLYPCHICADDFRKYVEDNPPRTESRQELSKWICELHNDVNKKLGKPSQSCNINDLNKRWRDGIPACWGEDDDDSKENGRLNT
jgi:mitochondrial FAD-linked sulfhydryl oxidase